MLFGVDVGKDRCGFVYGFECEGDVVVFFDGGDGLVLFEFCYVFDLFVLGLSGYWCLMYDYDLIFDLYEFCEYVVCLGLVWVWVCVGWWCLLFFFFFVYVMIFLVCFCLIMLSVSFFLWESCGIFLMKL